MTRFLRHTVGFVLTLALVLVGVDRGLAALMPRYEALKYQAMFDRQARYDHLIMGTSHALFGINPRLLDRTGASFYNFAYNGASSEFTSEWYALFRTVHDRPKLVILTADWFLLMPVMHRSLDQDSAFLPADTLLGLLSSPTHSTTALITNRFPILRDRHALMERLFEGPPAGTYDLAAYERGYMPYRVEAFRPRQPYMGVVQPRWAETFEKLVATLRRDGSRVVFVQTPEYLPIAGEHPRENAMLEAIAERHGAPFLNYNADRKSDLNTERAYFTDWGHLNAAGATRFSRRLAEDMIELGLMPGKPERMGKKSAPRSDP